MDAKLETRTGYTVTTKLIVLYNKLIEKYKKERTAAMTEVIHTISLMGRVLNHIKTAKFVSFPHIDFF